MSCILLHPMHNLPIANAIVRRDISVTPEIDAMPRRKRVRAIVGLMFQHNLEAYLHRYAGNEEAIKEGENFAKEVGSAFTASRTSASVEQLYALASSWGYQTSDHPEYDTLETKEAVGLLIPMLVKEGGYASGKDLQNSLDYQHAARDLWSSDPDSIRPLIDAAAKARAERKAGRPSKPAAGQPSDQVMELAAMVGRAHQLLASVLSDLDAMAAPDTEDNDFDSGQWFGPFSDYDANSDGGFVEWPNLAILREDIRKVVSQTAPAKAQTPGPTPANTPNASQPSAMAAFVSALVNVAKQVKAA